MYEQFNDSLKAGLGLTLQCCAGGGRSYVGDGCGIHCGHHLPSLGAATCFQVYSIQQTYIPSIVGAKMFQAACSSCGSYHAGLHRHNM